MTNSTGSNALDSYSRKRQTEIDTIKSFRKSLEGALQSISEHFRVSSVVENNRIVIYFYELKSTVLLSSDNFRSFQVTVGGQDNVAQIELAGDIMVNTGDNTHFNYLELCTKFINADLEGQIPS